MTDWRLSRLNELSFGMIAIPRLRAFGAPLGMTIGYNQLSPWLTTLSAPVSMSRRSITTFAAL